MLGIKVGTLRAASQNDVAGLVAFGAHNGCEALLGDRKEVMRMGSRADGVHGNLRVAPCSVLEPDGHRQAACQFAMDLAFCGSCADGTPRNEIGHELRGNRVEELGAGGHAQANDVAQEGPGDAQTLIDVEGAIEIGVVDETLPAYGCAGFLEVSAHHDHQIFSESISDFFEALGVLEPRLGVVHRAGADDDQKTIVFFAHDLGRFLASARRCGHMLLGGGNFLHDDSGRDQGANLVDAQIVGTREHG